MRYQVRQCYSVKEDFDDESFLIGPGRAIEPHRQMSIPEVQFHARVRHVVAATHQAVDGWRLSFVGQQRHANRLEDRRSYDTHRPRGRHAVGAGHSLEGDHRVRTKPVVAGVFLPRPDQVGWGFYNTPEGEGFEGFY